MSFADAIADFIHAMELEGIKPVEPVAQRLSSGELIRFRCDGDGKGRQNGWAILYLDERPAGAFGNYRLGISRKWHSGGSVSLSPEERRRLSEEWAQAKAKRQEERQRCEEEAACDAQEIWERAAPADSEHGYCLAKRLDPVGLRLDGDKLLIPMLDGAGRLWNLQRISDDGTKRFLRGGRTAGLFCVIGRFSRAGERVALGEGYATMAAVHRATGYPCIAAFSAANIAAVGRLWAQARPDLKFIICADDDAQLERNVGIEAAVAAAEEIGAWVALPGAVEAKARAA